MLSAHLNPNIDRYRWSPASRASPLAFSSRALLSSVSLQWRSRTLACDSSAASFARFPLDRRQALRGCSLGARGCMHSPLWQPFPDVHVLWPTGATQAGQPVRRRLAPPALSSPCSAGPMRSAASSPGCTTTACATSSVQSRRPPRRLARSAQKSRARLVWVRVVGLGLGSGLGLKVVGAELGSGLGRGLGFAYDLRRESALAPHLEFHAS